MALGVNILSTFDSRGVEKAIAEFSKLETTGQRAQFAIQKATIPATAALAGLAAAAGFSIKAAQEQQAQQQRLAQILTKTGGATREQIAALNDQAKALQQVGVVSAGNVTVLQSQLATFDLQYDTIARLTPAITDYVLAEKGASATAEDFKSMTNGLAQALNGQFGALTRVGFVLDDVTKEQIKNGTEAQRSAALVKVLNSTYGGFNESLRDTTAGSMQAFQNSLSDLRTNIGDALLPAFDKIVRSLSVFAELGARNTGVVLALMGVVGALSAAIVVASTAVKVHTTYQRLMEIEVLKNSRAMGMAGTAARGMGTALLFVAAAEGALALINKLTGSAERASKAFDVTAASLAGLRNGTNDASQVVENFFEVVKTESTRTRGAVEGLKETFTFKDFGREIETGLKLPFGTLKADIEDVDTAFKKFLTSSPPAAAELVAAMKVHAATLDVNSRAYKDLNMIIARYEAQVKLAKAATAGLNGEMAEVPERAFKMTAGLNMIATQHVLESRARLASTDSLEEWNRIAKSAFESTTKAASKNVLTAREQLERYTSALRSNYDAQRSVTSASNKRTEAEATLTNSIGNVAKAQEYFNRVTQGFSRDSREAIEATKSYADAQRRVRDAQISQRDAVLDLEKAEKRLRDLREITSDPESVADAERKLERAKYGVEEANFSVTDAERALAELRSKPDSSAIEIRRAEIRLAEAKLRVTESVKSVRDAEVSLNSEINRKATADEIAEAERGVERAKLRVQDATDAVKNATIQQAVAQDFLNQILHGATEETDAYKKALDALNKAKDEEKKARENVAGAILGEAQAMLALREAIVKLNQVSKITPSGVVSRGQSALQGISTSNPALSALNTLAGSSANTAPINLTVNAGMGTDGPGVAKEIIDVLKQYERMNGYIPITSQYQVAI